VKRFHVHLNVADLDTSVGFYSALFATEPSVRKPDYAKWMLDDPRINFAISTRGGSTGIDHLGLQVDSDADLRAIGAQLDAAGEHLVPEAAAVCCYARSDKLWTEDPQGVRWESFRTLGEATTYHAGDAACATDGASCSPDPKAMQASARPAAAAACCAPASGCC
jgi:catechol 2,3-dioxygenase-like lactoylglutathione lyase family enzyme